MRYLSVCSPLCAWSARLSISSTPRNTPFPKRNVSRQRTRIPAVSSVLCLSRSENSILRPYASLKNARISLSLSPNADALAEIKKSNRRGSPRGHTAVACRSEGLAKREEYHKERIGVQAAPRFCNTQSVCFPSPYKSRADSLRRRHGFPWRLFLWEKCFPFSGKLK